MRVDYGPDLLWGRLPDGCAVHHLTSHSDERGTLTELWSEDLGVAFSPAQWNAVRSNANTLRGVHAHQRHADLLHVVSGEMHLGLHDLRDGTSALVRLRPDPAQIVFIPAGVAHGFHTVDATVFVYALDERWTPSDELGCHWADPALDIPWRTSGPALSERDQGAGSLSDLRRDWSAAR